MADTDLNSLGAAYSLERDHASGGPYEQAARRGPSTRSILLIWTPILVLAIPFACWAMYALYQKLTAPLPDASDFGREPIDSAYAWGGRIAQFVVLGALSLIPVAVAGQKIMRFRSNSRQEALAARSRPASR